MVYVIMYYILVVIILCSMFSVTINEDGITSEKYENGDSTATVTTDDIQETQETTFIVPDDKWVSTALKDIAYYLRNYKFNEWDRRYYNDKPGDKVVGYYKSFPIPPLRSLHWKVSENCQNNFYKCIIYLHSLIETSPLSRTDDTSTIVNENIIPLNETTLKVLDSECKMAVSNSEKSGIPFDGPIEKFQWRTSASYYLCWYTLLETPALILLGEACDNFANCLDPEFGHQNKDPRAVDKTSFACASYSFCPDPCCPKKHIHTYNDCYENIINPCYTENSQNGQQEKTCYLHRKENQNFNDIVRNRWNVSCHCNDVGFKWKSQFGMCVDINECVAGIHNCNKSSQNCINIPGSYQCICRWDFKWDEEKKYCLKKKLFKESKLDIVEHFHSIKEYIKTILKNLGFKNLEFID